MSGLMSERGTAGLYGPCMEVNHFKWQCDEAKRVLVELDSSTYRRLGLEDVFLGANLQQNLAYSEVPLVEIALI